ncbi:Homeobox domain [Geosmithia morbida]|uniref:Homeobox domain n=1 Tax=Geosmithia morbida TaxID=1094350 RepID=A0A9P4YRK2_9HYPO|nr:Homeobox domain [Geosmithia morbida]KAF4120489.1 Homeobox domain [Geosmithia morbida]
MSEFVKQPHPDAAHRERLSMEIPGLSPRQVQVWFQNRRAKIKRLNVEDRDQVLKMRTVPAGFDNVQALHSPYGAFPGLGSRMSHTSEPGSQRIGDHDPLTADARISDRDDKSSASVPTPGYERASFHFPPPGRSTTIPTDYTTSADVGYGPSYGGQMSPLVGGASPYPANRPMFNSPSSIGRQLTGSPQPMNPSESFSRNRVGSDNPTVVPWKPDTVEYPGYPTPHGRSATQPLYRTASHPNLGIGVYNAGNYQDPSMQPPVVDVQQQQQQRPPPDSDGSRRFPPMPLNMDMRDHQYRMGSHEPSPLSQGQGQYPRPTSYHHTATYPPAPLTAPGGSFSHQVGGSGSEAAAMVPGGYPDNSTQYPATAVSSEFPRSVYGAVPLPPRRADSFGDKRHERF